MKHPVFYHSGDLGDIISSLPVIKALAGAGATLILGPGEGTREPMTQARADFIIPLLEAQPYIRLAEFRPGKQGLAIDHDLSTFREGYVTTVPIGEIIKRHVCPFQKVDFASPWLEVAPERNPSGLPVYARTARYHNPEIDPLWPHILRRHPGGEFIGLPEEHAAFESAFGVQVPHRKVKDALELAQVIAGSSIFIGNQSFPNLVAEGLKHNSITEHCKRQPDAFWKRANALRLHGRADWPYASEKPTLMLALQFWEGDSAQAMELARIIVSIEPKFREDVEFCLAIRDDVPQEVAERIARVTETRFRTIILRSKRAGRGWPDGCNDLWQSTMTQLANLKKANEVKAEAVLTFEPDCIPLRADWLDVLINEWCRVKGEGLMAFGTVHDAGGTAGLHINGNMVLDIMATKLHRELQTSAGCWDCYHSRLFLSRGRDSKTIIQRYGEKNHVPREAIEEIRKGGEVPAMLHGIKTGSGIDAVKEMIADGAFAARTASQK